MIRAIILDDELKSRESLKRLIEEFCQNVIVEATCQNIEEAVTAIDSLTPDLVFLDIQLQRETGFDLLTRYKNFEFEVIFTTAYSEYAIKAFKYSAIDYLLKPIDINELRQALSNAEKRKSNSITDRVQQLLQNIRSGNIENYKLALPTSDGLVFVKTNDILYCEASSNYTQITLSQNRKYLVGRTLKEYDDLLSGQNFFRIHHSYLINLDAIMKYVRGDGGYVIMNDNRSLDVSKRKKVAFLSRIGSKG